MKNTYAGTQNGSLFVQGVAQYTSVGAGFFNINGLYVGDLLGKTLGSIRYHARRRSIEAQLISMNDHMLTDIGVLRGDIPTFAREWAKSERPASAGAQTTGRLSAMVRTAVTEVMHWGRRQAVQAQLHGMSDRMLDDIGVERADIARIAAEWVVSVTVPAPAKIIGPNSTIGTIVTSDAVVASTIANDTTDLRVAG